MQGVFATCALAGFFGVIFTMMFIPIPAGAEQPLNVMLGVLGAVVTAICNYYFGSSAGSASKNATLDKMLDKTLDQPSTEGYGLARGGRE